MHKQASSLFIVCGKTLCYNGHKRLGSDCGRLLSKFGGMNILPKVFGYFRYVGVACPDWVAFLFFLFEI